MYSNEEGALRYQQTLVPLMFAPLARTLVQSAALARDARVLDIATGTGVVAREAAAASPAGRVFAFDANPNMLSVAQGTSARPGTATIEYRVATVEDAPLPAVGFDAVFCQQGLQFFEDPVAALLRIRRMLKPAGRLHVALWGAESENPFTMAIQNALRACGLEEFTGFLTRVHHLHEPERVISLLQSGSFRLMEHTVVRVTPEEALRPADAERLIEATPLAAKLATLGPARHVELVKALERELDRYAVDGVLRFEIPANLYHAHSA